MMVNMAWKSSAAAKLLITRAEGVQLAGLMVEPLLGLDTSSQKCPWIVAESKHHFLFFDMVIISSAREDLRRDNCVAYLTARCGGSASERFKQHLRPPRAPAQDCRLIFGKAQGQMRVV